MNKYMFDGGCDLVDVLVLDHIIENLPEESRERFIREYEEEDPEEWCAYLEHRKIMGYPEL